MQNTIASRGNHKEAGTNLENPYNHLEYGLDAQTVVSAVDTLFERTGIDHLIAAREDEKVSGLAHVEAEHLVKAFQAGTEQSIELAQLAENGEYNFWNFHEYRRRMQGIYDVTSPGQFVNVGGNLSPLHRIGGSAATMYVHYPELFRDGKGCFLDGLTNASVTSMGQGFPLQIAAANAMNRATGGTQCPPYHPGPLMEEAGNDLISVLPIKHEGAQVAWFNSGGDAVSVAIAAAEKYTTMMLGENGIRKAVFFKEAYHGNIEGRAGRATSGIRDMFHQQDQNSIELEFPNQEVEVMPVMEELKRQIAANKVSCIVFEATQGDGGGVSMHPDFFVELVKLSLDSHIPLVCDEVQSGFARSGKYFDVEYLLEHWQNSEYVKSGAYPEKPPMIMAVAKSITNGAAPGSAVIFPKEYAVLSRAQGLNTYSAHPLTLAAAIATTSLMTQETLAMVKHKRAVFDEAIDPHLRHNGFISEVRGHGLHLFVKVQNNQLLQMELLGRKRIITGTVSREALRIHAPLNAPDKVWHALGSVIGQVANDIEAGYVSPESYTILQGGPSGLAAR